MGFQRPLHLILRFRIGADHAAKQGTRSSLGSLLMNISQPGILAPVPSHARYLEFAAVADRDPVSVLRDLAARRGAESSVIGLGAGLVQGLGHAIEGLRPFPALSGPGCEVLSTQADLWCWVGGVDRGQIIHEARTLVQVLRPAFRCDRVVDGFKYDRGLDLAGYEDGTENPVGDAATAAAIVQGTGPVLDGSSFVAVQQWVHDLDHFNAMPQGERDDIIGRRLNDNEELEEAPISAHVKRTAQESFDPEAFVVRRSMPRGGRGGRGLDVRRLRQIPGRLRGAAPADERTGGQGDRRPLPFHPPGLRKLFLVTADFEWTLDSRRLGHLTTMSKNKDVYNATIKLFGSAPEPAFESPGRLKALWGREWGCDNDVGQLRAVLMHRPGDEFNVIDPAKRIEENGSFGDALTVQLGGPTRWANAAGQRGGPTRREGP